MIKRLLGRHRENAVAAARDWMALFAGEQGYEAMIAAMRLDTFVEAVISLAKAFSKRR